MNTPEDLVLVLDLSRATIVGGIAIAALFIYLAARVWRNYALERALLERARLLTKVDELTLRDMQHSEKIEAYLIEAEDTIRAVCIEADVPTEVSNKICQSVKRALRRYFHEPIQSRHPTDASISYTKLSSVKL